MEIARWNIFNNADLVVESVSNQSIDEVVLFGWFIRIYYKTKDEKILLFHDMPGSGLIELKSYLEKLLSSKLLYNNTSEYDLGFLYNESMPEAGKFISNVKHYEVAKYLVMQSVGDYSYNTWLYTTKSNKIMFEVTPNYPWTFRDPDPHEKYIEYEEWMKYHYKPLVRRIMSREEVEHWLQEVIKLYEHIKQNDERLRCRGEGCEMCAQEKAEGRQ